MGGGGRRPVTPAHLEDGDGDGEEGRRQSTTGEQTTAKRACPTGEEAGGDRASGGPRRPGSRGGEGPWRPAEERPEKRAAEDDTERAPKEQTTASGGAEI